MTWGAESRPTDVLGIFFLDVGQGDSSIILPPGPDRGAIVFDVRDAHVVNMTLQAWRVSRIEALIFSHLDWDHVAGGLELIRTWRDRLDAVYLSADRDISSADRKAVTAKNLVDEVRAAPPGGWDILPATADPRPVAVAEDGSWTIQVIAPSYAGVLDRERSGAWEDPNRASAVVRVETGGRAVLIGADAPLATWAELEPARLAADIFRIPHHGGSLDDGGVPAGWDVQRLYREVGADQHVLSVGTGNDHAHPSPTWIEPIHRGTCAMMCTQVTPLCHKGVALDATAWRQTLMSQFGLTGSHFVEPPWRHYKAADRVAGPRNTTEVPCAGTVMVRVTSAGELSVFPEAASHEDVVALWDDPRCRAERTPLDLLWSEEE